MTNCMAQPDDTDKGSTDVVNFFARSWAELGHNVVLVHNSGKFPLILYKLPQGVYSWLKKKQNITIPSVASRSRLEREDSGVKIIRLPITKFIPHGAFFASQYAKQADLIKDYLTELNFVPDVITGHWIEPQLKLINMLGKHYGAKTGFVIHGELPRDLKSEYVEYIKELDCFFTRSEPVKRKMMTDPNFSYLIPEKTSVCCSGIPDRFLAALSVRDDWKKDSIFKLIYVGRLVCYKRIDATLKALKQAFPNGGYVFDIVGDGPEKENLEMLARELGISDNVVFHGRVPRTQVIEMMSGADCFVMISENEVFGLVYLEAMACGCVTVASVDGGVDGIIVNEENGFLCEQGNADMLSTMLKEIGKMKKDSIIRMRQMAFNTVYNYSDSKVAERYLKDIVSRS